MKKSAVFACPTGRTSPHWCVNSRIQKRTQAKIMVDYKKKLCWYKYGKISIFMSFCGRTKLPFMMQHFTCKIISFKNFVLISDRSCYDGCATSLCHSEPQIGLLNSNEPLSSLLSPQNCDLSCYEGCAFVQCIVHVVCASVNPGDPFRTQWAPVSSFETPKFHRAFSHGQN